MAQLLLAQFPGRDQSTVKSATRKLIAACGSLAPQELSGAYVQEADDCIRRSGWAAVSKSLTAASLRRILRWLWEEHGAPKLDQHVRRYPAIRPRNVTVERSVIDAALAAVPDHVRLWLLLCSDLAIRAATAAALGPEQYHASTRTLRFTTKKQAKVTLPVTEDVRELIERCDQSENTAFVRQLWQRTTGPPLDRKTTPHNTTMSLRSQLRRSLAKAGIHQRLIPHDLRRTSAVSLYKLTRNFRAVQATLGHSSLQSTIWYLDHDLEEVPLEYLEAIKKPFIIHRKDTKTA